MYVTWSKDKFLGVIEIPEQVDGGHFFQLFKEIPRKEGECVEIDPASPIEACGLMAHFAQCANAKLIPPVELIEFVARAFERALESDDPAKSVAKELGLGHRRRGRPEDRARNARVYHRMEALIALGQSVLSAALTCAEEFDIHEANVQKIYYAYRTYVSALPKF